MFREAQKGSNFLLLRLRTKRGYHVDIPPELHAMLLQHTSNIMYVTNHPCLHFRVLNLFNSPFDGVKSHQNPDLSFLCLSAVGGSSCGPVGAEYGATG